MWNYSKHRGIFNFEGMGVNPSEMIVSFNNITAHIVSRGELDTGKLMNKLINFDVKYHRYLNDLIGFIFPKDFTNNLNFMAPIIMFEKN